MNHIPAAVTGHKPDTFDPSTHTYKINDRPVPGVTSVLRDLIPGWSASDWHLNRGRIVHQCAAGIARGKRCQKRRLKPNETRETHAKN